MVANYRTFTVTAEPDEDVVEIIRKLLKDEGYNKEPFELQFVGFFESAGVSFKINGNPLKVPNNGQFITPFGEEIFLRIKEMTFDAGCNSLNLWCIY